MMTIDYHLMFLITRKYVSDQFLCYLLSSDKERVVSSPWLTPSSLGVTWSGLTQALATCSRARSLSSIPRPRWAVITDTSFTSSSDWDLKFTWHSPDIHLTFTWSPDHHLTFPWPLPKLKCQVRTIWPSPDIHLISPNIHMKFTWPSPDHLTIIWPFPDHYLTIISNFQLNKSSYFRVKLKRIKF